MFSFMIDMLNKYILKFNCVVVLIGLMIFFVGNVIIWLLLSFVFVMGVKMFVLNCSFMEFSGCFFI